VSTIQPGHCGYTWNIEVSSAFWGAVHVLEVSLRNAENQQLTRRYNRLDWWRHPDVVAALPFGFWSGLLAPGGSAQYETKYWQTFLHKAFPQFLGPRSQLYRDVDSLRLFRNRIAHHEPVFFWSHWLGASGPLARGTPRECDFVLRLRFSGRVPPHDRPDAPGYSGRRARRNTAASPSAVPGQCRSMAAGPAVRVIERKVTTTAIASSA
jgi:hypothetical protein